MSNSGNIQATIDALEAARPQVRAAGEELRAAVGGISAAIDDMEGSVDPALIDRIRLVSDDAVVALERVVADAVDGILVSLDRKRTELESLFD